MKNTSNEKSLSHKVINSTMWLFGFQIFDNFLAFIRIIFLAKLLSPTDFGLVGAAWLTLQIINTFTVMGINQVLIHKQKMEPYLNTAWTLTVLRGIILFAFILFIAPLAGGFFNSHEVIPILQIIGLTVLISGFGNIGTIYFQKEMRFQRQFIIQITQNTTDFIVTLVFALLLQNAWAIVFGAVMNSIVGTILSYILSPYRPKLDFNLKKIKEMNDYGKWIGGSTILQFLYSQGDDILVGKLLGVTSLGYYQLAYRISNLPATQITHLISTVMFPAYATIQHSVEKIRSIYFSILQVITYLSFFIGIIIICFAYDFTVLFLGKQWLPIVSSLQLLTLWGLIRSVGATTGPVWQALGIPNKTTKIQLIQVTLLAVSILPLTIKFNITGTAIAVVLSALIPNIISIYMINRTLKSNVSKFLIELGHPFIAGLVMAFVYYLLRTTIFIDTTWLSFILLALICFVTYIVVTYMQYRFFGYTIYTNIYNLLTSNKKNNKIASFIVKTISRFIKV